VAGNTVIVDMRRQSLPYLAAYLLDPESDDSFFTWNLFDATLSRQRLFPVLRRAKP
jgi:hypothetical protein